MRRQIVYPVFKRTGFGIPMGKINPKTHASYIMFCYLIYNSERHIPANSCPISAKGRTRNKKIILT
jgi:hypothetical protein